MDRFGSIRMRSPQWKNTFPHSRISRSLANERLDGGAAPFFRWAVKASVLPFFQPFGSSRGPCGSQFCQPDPARVRFSMSLDPQTGLEPGKQEIEHLKTTGLFTTWLLRATLSGPSGESKSHFRPSFALRRASWLTIETRDDLPATQRAQVFGLVPKNNRRGGKVSAGSLGPVSAFRMHWQDSIRITPFLSCLFLSLFLPFLSPLSKWLSLHPSSVHQEGQMQ